MNQRTYLAILWQLSETTSAISDADLLSQFIANRDEEAFVTLLRRHGRLVWSICHHLAGSEAEDAFQATFLVLLRNAKKVRNANRLSSWLHGVAYRVCTKARLSAKRRLNREQTVALIDRDSAVVSNSAWDRALTALHEELVTLPEKLREPFVLCTLEGKSVTEVAELLGVKLSTLSARLARAKDSLLARLDARGITAGAVAIAACTATNAPADVLVKATGMVRGGMVVSNSILQLTQGVMTMHVNHAKTLAAGILLAFGIGIGSGAGWLATADAQQPPPMSNVSPDDRVKQLEELLRQARQDADKAKRLEAIRRMAKDRAASLSHSTTRWNYQFTPVSEMDTSKFVKLLNDRESNGWDFAGQITLKQDDKVMSIWAFRKLKKAEEQGLEVNGGQDLLPVEQLVPPPREYNPILDMEITPAPQPNRNSLPVLPLIPRSNTQPPPPIEISPERPVEPKTTRIPPPLPVTDPRE